MTRLHITFGSVPSTIGWGGLVIFARHVAQDTTSATFRAVNSDYAPWLTTFRTNELLADLVDAVLGFQWSVAAGAAKSAGKAAPPMPEPYPRPWVEDKTRKSIGSDAIPVSDFAEWYFGGES